MCRMTAVLVTLLCLAAAREGAERERTGVHLWRGEYERAIEAAGEPPAPELDSYRAMADRLDDVPVVVPAGGDSLQYAFIAFHTKRFTDALALSASSLDDPFLDVYRRLIRGVSLLEEKRFAEAAGELDSLLAFIGGGVETSGHPATGRAANAYVEAMAACPDRRSAPDRALPYRDDLSGRSRFLLCRICLDASRSEEAVQWFSAGIEAGYDSTAFPLFEELAEEPAFRCEAIARERVESIAEYALHRPGSRTARRVISYLRRVHPGEGTVRLLDACYHAAAGETKRAISAARGVFDSNADVALKKRAALLVASWQYAEKQYRSAQESYRIFGMYYPSDHRSVRALDTAARIAVARKRWDEALAIWETLRLRGLHSPLAEQAALSEAVLRYRGGATEDAHRILAERLPDADPTIEGGLLYWLFRTAGSPEERERWRERLLAAHPRSFYAAAARGADSLFTAAGCGSGDTDAVGALEAMERSERALFTAVTAAVDTTAPPAAYGAYRYFLSRGFRAEALECGKHIARSGGGDREWMLTLYRDARSRGVIDLALSLTTTPALANPGSGLPAPLHFPIAYTGLIAETSGGYGVCPILLLAVIREESRFNPDARSGAGAVGLMQLMPSTGDWLSAKIGVDERGERQLLSPSFSITAGGWYLRHLIERSDGSLVAALAAYNAGLGRMADWVREFEPAREPMIAVEMIGIRETREYVKRVLDTMTAYRAFYPPGRRDEG